MTLKNTILAGNEDLTAGPLEPYFPDCFAATSLVSRGYNLIGKRSIGCPITAGSGDMIGNLSPGIDPGRLSLTSDGAVTYYHPLAFSSLAVDRANPAGCKDFANVILGVDQRGETRKVGVAGDIGAIENQVARRYVYLPLTMRWARSKDDDQW